MSPAAVTVAFGKEELAALDRYIEQRAPAYSRAELIAQIVAEWAKAQGAGHGAADEGLRPDELNASNDS
ncbi:conserved hypothetical protein [Hyphomicrobiales bacterium]|nr:conserved hypothetical protein [Hyphomicrobiales bacterium]CAI0345858.1 conserved hypothetical protein [Hyphomicrobiales bacterium]